MINKNNNWCTIYETRNGEFVCLISKGSAACRGSDGVIRGYCGRNYGALSDKEEDIVSISYLGSMAMISLKWL